MTRIFAFWAFVAVASPSWALECAGPTTLPSSDADILWRTTGANVVLVEGADTFLVSATSLRKLETRTGRQVWSLRIGEDYRILDTVVLPAHIAFIRNGQHIVFIDRESGQETHKIDAGRRIARLIGPPLVAVIGEDTPRGQIRSVVRIADDGVLS